MLQGLKELYSLPFFIFSFSYFNALLRKIVNPPQTIPITRTAVMIVKKYILLILQNLRYELVITSEVR
jgi:hypothetical protein